MELTWIEDFISLAGCGSFSRAAEQRGVTQPAFGRRIRALENWVGGPLFDRSGHQVTLNAAGHAFHPTAEEVLRRLRLGRSQAREAIEGSVLRDPQQVQSDDRAIQNGGRGRDFANLVRIVNHSGYKALLQRSAKLKAGRSAAESRASDNDGFQMKPLLVESLSTEEEAQRDENSRGLALTLKREEETDDEAFGIQYVGSDIPTFRLLTYSLTPRAITRR